MPQQLNRVISQIPFWAILYYTIYYTVETYKSQKRFIGIFEFSSVFSSQFSNVSQTESVTIYRSRLIF